MSGFEAPMARSGPLARELRAALAHLQHLAQVQAARPHEVRHVTTPEAEISSCTIRLSLEEAAVLWAAGTVALRMGAADGW